MNHNEYLKLKVKKINTRSAAFANLTLILKVKVPDCFAVMYKSPAHSHPIRSS